MLCICSLLFVGCSCSHHQCSQLCCDSQPLQNYVVNGDVSVCVCVCVCVSLSLWIPCSVLRPAQVSVSAIYTVCVCLVCMSVLQALARVHLDRMCLQGAVFLMSMCSLVAPILLARANLGFAFQATGASFRYTWARLARIREQNTQDQ